MTSAHFVARLVARRAATVAALLVLTLLPAASMAREGVEVGKNSVFTKFASANQVEQAATAQ